MDNKLYFALILAICLITKLQEKGFYSNFIKLNIVICMKVAGETFS